MRKMNLMLIKDYLPLKTQMNKDNATSFKDILVLFDLLKNINQHETHYLKQMYSQNAENFEDCIDFISSIKLINIISTQIELSSQLSKFLLRRPDENEIRELILNKLLNKRNVFVWEYLEKFSASEGKYIFEPQILENLRFSNLRNLLIELEFVFYNPDLRFYEISEKYLPLFTNLVKEHKISPENLKLIIEEQERIGKYAEFEVVVYEQARLSSREDLLSKIEHKSLEDSTVGYDIRSFTLQNNEDVTERFIEVKAISKFEKKFFMSRNEVEKSKIYRDNYYLYLLPVVGKYIFDLNNLIIIQDPSDKIFNGQEWVIECEQFSIKKNENE